MISGWVRDRLPPTLQGGVGMSAAHLVVVVVVLAMGVAATLWWVSHADGGETALPPPAAPASPMVTMPSDPTGAEGPQDASAPGATPTTTATPAGGGGSAGPSPTTTGSVVVDVAGKVRRPGIATLPLGARVVDALEAAGGARRGVPLGSLNLARVLTDGEQVVVGVPGPPGVAASAASAPTAPISGSGGAVPMVNINTAGQAELEQLPGIGPVTAQSILAFRTERGTFTSVDELLEVSGIGDVTLAEIAPFVTL
jgi:competence protein ComEA